MSELMNDFKNAAGKLKKVQRVVFKWAHIKSILINDYKKPIFICRKHDSIQLSAEFKTLANKFEELNHFSNYSGLCYLGVGKCHESSGDIESFTSFMKGARSFRKCDEQKTKLGALNNHENLEVNA
jgi:hypothetical protein